MKKMFLALTVFLFVAGIVVTNVSSATPHVGGPDGRVAQPRTGQYGCDSGGKDCWSSPSFPREPVSCEEAQI